MEKKKKGLKMLCRVINCNNILNKVIYWEKKPAVCLNLLTHKMNRGFIFFMLAVIWTHFQEAFYQMLTHIVFINVWILFLSSGTCPMSWLSSHKDKVIKQQCSCGAN